MAFEARQGLRVQAHAAIPEGASSETRITFGSIPTWNTSACGPLKVESGTIHLTNWEIEMIQGFLGIEFEF
jgi:hypothetical protein